MLSKKVHTDDLDERHQRLASAYGSRGLSAPVPKYELPEGQMPAQVAYQLVHDEMNLDGNPALNLASFVTTWMEPEADRLMSETMGKNYIDADEYPQTTAIQDRCVNMLAGLFNAPKGADTAGTATVGSSEAIHLAGLALKWKWRRRRAADGKAGDRPNIVMSSSVQVCWEKFARYFDVEPRYLPLQEGRYVLDPDAAVAAVDENTIGVVGILGSTYTGEYEPISALNKALGKLNQRTGWDVGIHVDGASGAFVAPFLDSKLEWDFRLPLVRSINASGHKYGLVYPGVGWVIWRDVAELPEELIFHVNYLGGDQPTFSLNFSRGAGQIVAQYYNFLRLGNEGYSAIMRSLRSTADYLVAEIDAIQHFEVLSNRTSLPLVCFRLAGERPYTVFDISEKIRERGWIVPAYSMAPGAEDVSVLRVVVREGLSRDMAELLIGDLRRVVGQLDALHKAPTASRLKPRQGKTKGVC